MDSFYERTNQLEQFKMVLSERLGLLSLYNRTNAIMETARKHKIKKKKDDSINRVLSDFVLKRKEKNLKDLKGKISFREDYDYKSLRK